MSIYRTRGSVPETKGGFSLLEAVVAPGSNISNVGALSGGSVRRVNAHTAMQVSAVFACVRNLCEDFAKLKVEVWKCTWDRKDNLTKVSAIRHPLRRLLMKPNRYQDRFQFFETLMCALVMRGNAYTVIIRDGNGQPTALIPVHPDRVIMLETEDGKLIYRITSAGVFENAQLRGLSEYGVSSDDVIHTRGLSSNGIMGLSPLAFASQTVGLALTAEEHQSGLFSRGARPGGALKHPEKISKEAGDRLLARWEGLYGGSDKSGKTILLEEGMEFQPMGMTSVDAEFLESRKYNVEEIARFFRMPLHLIGHLDRSTNNNITQQSLEYLTNTLSSYIERFEASFSDKFDLGEDYLMEFDVWSLLRLDMPTLVKTMREAKMGGLISTNEGRKKMGLNPTPEKEGDIVYQPLNMGKFESLDDKDKNDTQVPENVPND